MFTGSTKIRIHYALTDQMGFVYYGNYAQLFEIARAESIRQLGYTYKQLEAMGVMMAVGHMDIQYKRPILYDELITVNVLVKDWPGGKSILFYGEIFNEAGELCTTSHIKLYFIDSITRRPTSLPQPFAQILAPYFPEHSASASVGTGSQHTP